MMASISSASASSESSVGAKRTVYTFPSSEAFKAIKRKVKALTRAATRNLPLRQLLFQLNPLIRGWTVVHPPRCQRTDLRLPGPLLLVVDRVVGCGRSIKASTGNDCTDGTCGIGIGEDGVTLFLPHR